MEDVGRKREVRWVVKERNSKKKENQKKKKSWSFSAEKKRCGHNANSAAKMGERGFSISSRNGGKGRSGNCAQSEIKGGGLGALRTLQKREKRYCLESKK